MLPAFFFYVAPLRLANKSSPYGIIAQQHGEKSKKKVSRNGATTQR